MSNETKACNLTEEEIKTLIGDHGRNLIEYTSALGTYAEERLERINYLNKRLKAFSEPDKVENNKTEVKQEEAPATPVSKAW